MNSRFRLVALLLVLGLGVSALVSTSVAAPPTSKLLLQPGGGGGNYGLPKFGFSSSNNGFGERVLNVRWGSRAQGLGLEPGDVILSLNGYRLSYPGSWSDALAQALYDGNYVRLKVRDVRTGNIRFRETYVGYNNGPVQNYYKTNPNVGPKPHVDFKPIVPNFKTIKDLKKLVN
jgi:predicted metalloprotease with PDZ domain